MGITCCNKVIGDGDKEMDLGGSFEGKIFFI